MLLPGGQHCDPIPSKCFLGTENREEYMSNQSRNIDLVYFELNYYPGTLSDQVCSFSPTHLISKSSIPRLYKLHDATKSKSISVLEPSRQKKNYVCATERSSRRSSLLCLHAGQYCRVK
jgi:hypothetical protein